MHCTDSTVKLLQYRNAIDEIIQECEIRTNIIYAFGFSKPLQLVVRLNCQQDNHRLDVRKYFAMP